MLGDSFSSSWRGENEVIKGGDQTRGFGGVGEALCSWKHPWAPLQTLKKSVGPEGRAGAVKPTDSSGGRGKLSVEPADWLQRVTLM